MLDQRSLSHPQGLRADINALYHADEHPVISMLIERAELSPSQSEAVRNLAKELVAHVRTARKNSTGIESFLAQYSLSSEEGIALMCLAEALLRVPDKSTIDVLIKDKLATADWKAHLGSSDSMLVNATTWALMLTGKVLSPEKAESVVSKAFFRVVNRSSEGVLRKAVDAAMRIMSKQFVMGRTINEAINRAKKLEAQGYRYSYDMLGEAALTAEDAEEYFQAYKTAIEKIGSSVSGIDIYKKPGISIKLSALHPRYEEAKHDRVLLELVPRLLSLAQLAKKLDIALTVDAEESERLDISLDVMERVFNDSSLDGWNGFGLALQTYQKRAIAVLDWVADLARTKQRRIMVRLIKGAYWDSEIKKAQMAGLSDYPVFTRKAFTDVSFQACVKKVLTMTDAIFPQFATHNAYSVALVLKLVGDYRDFEFQCLHGMGSELYEQIVPAEKHGIPCRIYAPVGVHEDLLPYLVRRLLENGANSSFVNRIVDEQTPLDKLVEDPVAQAKHLLGKINQNIPLPKDIFLPSRFNSNGVDWSDRSVLANIQQQLSTLKQEKFSVGPIIAGQALTKKKESAAATVRSPQALQNPVGEVYKADEHDIAKALDNAESYFPIWSQKLVEERASCLENFAHLLEKNQLKLMMVLCREAGKTWLDATAEVRESVDFCRYYAAEARILQGQPTVFHGYTGESNQLRLCGRGTIACISPWNFPLAIFTGQVVAALVMGNCVLAKPAEQTPTIAYLAVQLMIEAGIPPKAVQLIPGRGSVIGAKVIADQRIKGVIFTGSTQTANTINQTLATRGGAIVPLIAETGGQNAMIVDSSALLEQVTKDVLLSAFGSAGQRCSALRVLYIQDEIYNNLVTLLKGAMEELRVGDPAWLVTDVGPVIDAAALEGIQTHVEAMTEKYELLYQCKLTPDCTDGHFMPPTMLAIDHINALKEEVFGPVLHVIRYKRSALDDVIAQINQTGYGLTFGIHSRINSTIKYIQERVHVGNCYVNRNTTGAVVGLQPFGGEGLSGTGPKAGGPHYLPRLCYERTITVDTTAAGGNASLMSISEDL